MGIPFQDTAGVMYEPTSKIGFWLPGMARVSENETAALVEQGFQPIAGDLGQLLAFSTQFVPLVQVVTPAEQDGAIWACFAEPDLVPVALGFVQAETPERGVERAVPQVNGFLGQRAPRPPANLGSIGVILSEAEGKLSWVHYRLAELTRPQHQLQHHLQALLQALTTPALGEEDHALHWKQVQQTALGLARAYWSLHRSKEKTSAPPVVNVFYDGETWGPTVMPILSVLSAIQNAASGRKQWESSDHPTFTHTYRSGQTSVFLQPPKPPKTAADQQQRVISETTVHSLWEQVGKMKDLDADLVLIQLAQHATAPKLPDGSVWITPEMILLYRGIQPKKHKAFEGGWRSAGYLEVDKQAVREAFERIDWLWITVSRRQRGKKLLTLESKFIDIRERWQERLFEEEEAHIGAWRFMPGTWLDELLTGGDSGKQFGRYLQQVLRYDPLHQTWEKRLARYFVFHLRLAARVGSHTIRRTVGELLRECSLAENDGFAHRNPERIRDRFHQAMEQLQADALMAEWRYVAELSLPPRQWFEPWKASLVEISIAPLLPAGAAAPMEEAAKPSSTRKATPPREKSLTPKRRKGSPAES